MAGPAEGEEKDSGKRKWDWMGDDPTLKRNFSWKDEILEGAVERR